MNTWGDGIARWHGRAFICPTGPILNRIPTNSTHLDIGCGRGLLLAAAAVERRTRSIGCDTSKRATIAAANLTASLAAERGYQ
jgi:methylase of polypeptide subunit release factors